MIAADSDQYLYLDDRELAWRGALSGLVRAPADGPFTLEPLPGRAGPLLAREDEEALACLAALAAEGCGRLLVADAAQNRVLRVTWQGPGARGEEDRSRTHCGSGPVEA